jgi:TonB family protein
LAARTSNVEGTVHLSLLIGPDGHVSKVDVLSSSDLLLTMGTVSAVQQWVFEPQLVEGKAASITRDIYVSFGLLPALPDSRSIYSVSYLGDNEIRIQMSASAPDALPDNSSYLVAYFQGFFSAQASEEIIRLTMDQISSSPVPFSFALKNTESGSYSIQIEDRNTSYECHGMSSCAVLLNSYGAARASGTTNTQRFGLLVDLYTGPNQDQLGLTCLASQCTIGIMENGKTTSRKLTRNESARVPDSARISGNVN